MAVTAKLRVRLLAEEVVVAESDDAGLWHRVFGALHGGSSRLGDGQDEPGTGERSNGSPGEQAGTKARHRRTSATGIESFAEELGLSVEEVEGACGPSPEAPYLHLDSHCWEALKKNTPKRGPSAISPIALAATVLALWFRHAGMSGGPTVQQCQEALETMNLADKNPQRGVRNCDWLKSGGSGITINPASMSKAIRMAAAFCSKKPPAVSE